MCSIMFIATLFVIKNQKTTEIPLDQRMDKKKKWYIYTMEYYTVGKKDILKFAGKCMDLENIILNEVTQTHKGKYNMYSLIKQSKTSL